jgi:hypothetical protein
MYGWLYTKVMEFINGIINGWNGGKGDDGNKGDDAENSGSSSGNTAADQARNNASSAAKSASKSVNAAVAGVYSSSYSSTVNSSSRTVYNIEKIEVSPRQVREFVDTVRAVQGLERDILRG